MTKALTHVRMQELTTNALPRVCGRARLVVISANEQPAEMVQT